MDKSFASLAVLLSFALVAGCSDDRKEQAKDTGEDHVFPDGSETTGPPADPWCNPNELPEYGLEPIAGDHTYASALHLTQSPDDDETLYVVERKGRILAIQDGEVRDQPFLDLRNDVRSQYPGRGLLGLAFHPKYAENGRFFVSYTPSGASRNVIAEYQRSENDPYRANPEEVQRLVDLEDPRKQHNGGNVRFGPDGYLYASLGNGGAKQKRKHDGIGRAQYLGSVFGTIMRMDVDRSDQKFAAPGNPFADREDADPRIFVYGLRNPWSFSFDRKTGDMYIADAGKKSREEIDYVDASSNGGHNFGWPAWEGTKDGPVDTAEKAVEEHAEPLYEYRYNSSEPYIRGGKAVIGGQVYRGSEFPELQGYYVYGDLASDDLAAMMHCDTADADAEPEIVDHKRVPGVTPPNSVRAVVPDNSGTLYVVSKKKVRRLIKP